MSLIGRGANSAVYQLSTLIVVKRARSGKDEEAEHANEQKIFQFLKNRPLIPYLIRCVYQRPNDTFLELAPNGSVAMLLNQYQKRDGMRVLNVAHTLCLGQIHHWMKQLSLAAAALEECGLTHGDIRPGNMLLDSNLNLKLSDLDRALEIGGEVAVMTEPFGRLLGKGDGIGAGTYGKAGARTETFAIGSIYYSLLRGHEPYETEFWGNEHDIILMDKFQNKEFPTLTSSTSDTIINRCWNGEYLSVKDLLAEFAADGARQDHSNVEDQEWLQLRQLECDEFIQSGLVDTLERY